MQFHRVKKGHQAPVVKIQAMLENVRAKLKIIVKAGLLRYVSVGYAEFENETRFMQPGLLVGEQSA